MENIIETLNDLVSEIRNLINQPRKKYLLMGDLSNWDQLCSSMDVLGDTDLAIIAYNGSFKNINNKGELYLLIYGVLQILIVQQDAVINMNSALGFNSIPLFDDPTIKFVRDVRNKSVGHPTKKKLRNEKQKSIVYNFISRATMSKEGFQLITIDPAGETTITNVDITELIENQQLFLKQCLSQIINNLKKEEMDHKQEFQDDKLEDIFSVDTLYYIEKIEEEIFDVKRPGIGIAGIATIQEVLNQFKTALLTRKIYEPYNMVDEFDLVNHSLNKISQFLTNEQICDFSEKDAVIFLSFVRKKIKDFKDLAKELDDDYLIN